MASKKSEILHALGDRLRTITTGNGYDLTVNKVFGDDDEADGKIPMAMDLYEELPAILMIDADDKISTQHHCVDGQWNIELQLVASGDRPDSFMLNFVRAVYKAVFADSSTAHRNDAFRGMHPSVYDVKPLDIQSDLNMIETNRVYFLTLSLSYRAHLWDL